MPWQLQIPWGGQLDEAYESQGILVSLDLSDIINALTITPAWPLKTVGQHFYRCLGPSSAVAVPWQSGASLSQDNSELIPQADAVAPLALLFLFKRPIQDAARPPNLLQVICVYDRAVSAPDVTRLVAGIDR